MGWLGGKISDPTEFQSDIHGTNLPPLLLLPISTDGVQNECGRCRLVQGRQGWGLIVPHV